MNICIVEDNQVVLGSLKLLLEGEPNICVLGAYPSAEKALAEAVWDHVEILLADIELPGMTGVDLIRKVKADHPSVETMAYTICENRSVVMDAIRAGASGYLLKGSTPRALVESLHELYAGGAPMSPRVARKVLAEFRQAQTAEPSPADGESDVFLTAREKSVVRGIEAGLSYDEIGSKLRISPHTVHTHIKNIYAKVHATSRADLIIKSRRLGII